MGCKALKARLLLTRASELNDKALYEQAYTLAKEVIDNGPFELSKDFASVFDMENSDGNGNKEVIKRTTIFYASNHTGLVIIFHTENQMSMVTA